MDDRRDVDRARRALAGLHEADADGRFDVGTPCASLTMSTPRCISERAEEFLKEVVPAPTTAPLPTERAGKVLETPETETTTTTEGGPRVLKCVGVEPGLLRRGAVLVVLRSLLVVFQDLHVERVQGQERNTCVGNDARRTLPGSPRTSLVRSCLG